MPKHVTTTDELRSMSVEDLRKEVREVGGEMEKKRLAVRSRTEKDTAAFTRSKRQFARILTILTEKTSDKALKPKPKTSTVRVSSST